MSTETPNKRDVANQLIRKGSIFIHLDPRVTDVVAPPWLRHQPQLVLQVGYDMPIPIHDLRVDDDGIFGTLSFSRTPFGCNMPWSAVFALVGEDGRGMVWPESMPPEIVAEVEKESKRSAKAAEKVQYLSEHKSKTQEPVRSHFKRKPKPLPPYMRVIK
jgi:Stringent starvation protein B